MEVLLKQKCEGKHSETNGSPKSKENASDVSNEEEHTTNGHKDVKWTRKVYRKVGDIPYVSNEPSVMELVNKENDAILKERPNSSEGARPSSRSSDLLFKSVILPPRPSSSRGMISSTDLRCDPVRLYHWYEKLWKCQPTVGCNDHRELRWAVRHYMNLNRDVYFR
ncbi:uncharacterized protein LOC136026502 isoform X2 [Artemia franciscana]